MYLAHRLLPLLLLASCTESPSCPSSPWTTERLDSLSQENSRIALDLDASGRPHIAFVDAAGQLLHAFRDAEGAWQEEPVGTSLSWAASLVVDDAGRVHIVYFDARTSVHYARRDSDGSWSTETVATATALVDRASIAVAPSGLVHVSYTTQGSCDEWCRNSVFHARRDAAGWVGDLVSIDDDSGYDVSLAVDADDVVHIAYADYAESRGGPNNLHYARLSPSGAWEIEDFAAGGRLAIALDEQGGVHVAYDAELRLHYAFRSPTDGWATTALAFSGMSPSIDLDDAHGVHISYFRVGLDAASGELGYAYGSPAGDWRAVALDSTDSTTGTRSAVAVDPAGTVHVLYNVDSTQLGYAEQFCR